MSHRRRGGHPGQRHGRPVSFFLAVASSGAGGRAVPLGISRYPRKISRGTGRMAVSSDGGAASRIFHRSPYLPAKRKNEVFSQDSAINETLNRLQKRAWTGSMIGADYASFAEFSISVCGPLWGGQLTFADYLVFLRRGFSGRPVHRGRSDPDPAAPPGNPGGGPDSCDSG